MKPNPSLSLPDLAVGCLVVTLALVAASPPARAAGLDLAAEADVLFEMGVEAQRANDFKTAVAHYLASYRLSPNKNVMFNAATCFERLERYPEAFRYYRTFLEEKLEPEERRLAEAGLARVRPHVAVLAVATTPAGATLYLDRKDLGSVGLSPRVLAVAPGVHRIIAEADGHRSATSADVRVAVGEQRSVELALAPILGFVEVAGEPAGATLKLEGAADPTAVLGTVPAKLALVPGRRALIVEAPDRRRARVEVEVVEEQTTRIEVALEPETGSVLVDADETGALIELDGRAVGFTPTVLPDIPTGVHRVRVSRFGFVPYETEVAVPVDGEVKVVAKLNPSSDITAASRVTQRAEDAPASVSLLSAEEIRAFGYQSVWDALGGQRGIYQTDDRTYASLGFRGFSQPQDYGNRVLVLVDGHPINDDLLGSSYTQFDGRTDLLDLERIELVRGPGSVLYGTNAFFGVINLVTRSAGSVPPPHVSIASDGPRMSRVSAGGGYEFGKDAGFWASAGGIWAQGDDLFLKEVGDLGGTEVRGADGFYTASAAARAWWHDFTVEASFHRRDKRIPTGSFDSILGDPRAHIEDTRAFVEARWEPKLTDWLSLNVRAFLDLYALRDYFPYAAETPGDPSTLGIDAWDGVWVGGEARATITPLSWLRFTVGAEGRGSLLADMESGQRNDDGTQDTYLHVAAPTYAFAAYALGGVKPFDALALDLGVRYDYASTFVDGAFSPRAALVLHAWEGGTVKLLGGSAFRAPSVYELRYHDGGTTEIAPDSLAPERIITGEVELSQRFGDVVLTGSFFFNRLEGLVTTELVDLNDDGLDDVFRYANADGAAHTLGAEAEVRRELGQGWMVAATYSFQRTRVADRWDDAPAAKLTNSPEHLASVRGIVPLVRGVASLASRLRFESPRLALRVDDAGDATLVEGKAALLWDVTVSGEVRAFNLEWAVGVRNLLDWRVRQPAGGDIPYPFVPQPGRTFFVQLGVAL